MKVKYQQLLLGLAMDGLGLLTSSLTIVGDFADVAWAPFSAFVMFKMYKGSIGKVGGLISFVEEAGILGTDIVPTFTIMWIYKYVIAGDNKGGEVESNGL